MPGMTGVINLTNIKRNWGIKPATPLPAIIASIQYCPSYIAVYAKVESSIPEEIPIAAIGRIVIPALTLISETNGLIKGIAIKPMI